MPAAIVRIARPIHGEDELDQLVHLDATRAVVPLEREEPVAGAGAEAEASLGGLGDPRTVTGA